MLSLSKLIKSTELKYLPCGKHRLRLITPVVSGGWRSAVKMRRVVVVVVMTRPRNTNTQHQDSQSQAVCPATVTQCDTSPTTDSPVIKNIS